MRILITGGLGYVGGRLAQCLCDSGFEVILATRNPAQYLGWAPTAVVKHISWDNSDNLFQLCQGVNCIFHAAGMNARDCNTDPLAASQFNTIALGLLIDAACKAKVSKFIMLSTVHVYDTHLTGHINEYSVPSNLHPYATSNLEAECLVLNSDIKSIVLRLSNVFGSPCHPDISCWSLFVNDICRQLSTCQHVSINSNPNLRRDFVPMSFVLHFLLSLVPDNDFTNLAFSCNIINLCSQRTFSLSDMASRASTIYSKINCIETSISSQASTYCPSFDINTIHQNIINSVSLDMIDAELEALIRFCSINF